MDSSNDGPDAEGRGDTPTEEAQWALATARTLQDRGDTETAVTWYRRAVEHLMDAGDDEQALDIARLAASLSSAPPPPARVVTPPGLRVSGSPSAIQSSPPRVLTQPSRVPASMVLDDAIRIDPIDLSASGEVATQLSAELQAALRRAVTFQPARGADGDQLAGRLAALALFRELPTETVRTVARQGSVLRFEAHEHILVPNHAPPEPPLFVILEGRGILRATGDEGPGTPLTVGDFVGEVAALYGGSGMQSATAREPVTAVALPRSLIAWLAREFPTVRVALEDVAWERSFSSVGRAASFLRRLPPDQRGVAYARFEPVLLNAGDLLLGEATPPLAFWIIAAGEVEVYGGGISGREPLQARAGDALGLRAILENELSGVTARTLGTVLAAKVGAASFRALVEKHPRLAGAVDDIGMPGRAVVC